MVGPDKTISLDDDGLIPAKSPTVLLHRSYNSTTCAISTNDGLIHVWKYGGEKTDDGKTTVGIK